MTQHIAKCVDTIIQKHPSTGIMITGDMNQLKDAPTKSAYALQQIVLTATRGSKILDKVLTNMPSLYTTPDILPQIGKSDHHAVLCRPAPDYSSLGVTPIKLVSRSRGKNEKALFAGALMNFKWDPLYRMTTCKEQFEFLSQNINDMLDHFLPLKTTTKRSSDKPWITEKYRNLIKKRQKALYNGNTAEYKRLRNLINRLTRTLRSTYYQTKVSGLSEENSKKWWSSVNELMGKKQSSNAMINLANQHTDGNVEVLANKINKTFQSVSASLPKLTPTHQHPPSCLPDRYCVSVAEVEKRLFAINPRKAMGPDYIPNWVFSDFSGYLAAPIASIFSASFREGYIPDIWKCADVVPLPKVNPPQKIEKDLQPILLTPVISKTQEAFMHQ
jgi:hypothetical protein